MQIQKINSLTSRQNSRNSKPSFGLKLSPSLNEDIFQGATKQFQLDNLPLRIEKLFKTLNELGDDYSLSHSYSQITDKKDRINNIVKISLSKTNADSSVTSKPILQMKFTPVEGLNNDKRTAYDAFTTLTPEMIRRAV